MSSDTGSQLEKNLMMNFSHYLGDRKNALAPRCSAFTQPGGIGNNTKNNYKLGSSQSRDKSNIQTGGMSMVCLYPQWGSPLLWGDPGATRNNLTSDKSETKVKTMNRLLCHCEGN